MKLQLYGMAYYNIHPKIIYHVTLLEGWKPFEHAVLAGDWKQKFDAQGNREWAGNPAGKLPDGGLGMFGLFNQKKKKNSSLKKVSMGGDV